MCGLGGGLTSKAALFALLLRPLVSKRPIEVTGIALLVCIDWKWPRI